MKKSIQFITIVCLVSWLTAGVAFLCGLRHTGSLGYTVFASAYMLLPALCAVVLQKIHGEPLFKGLGVSLKVNGWFGVAIITPILLAFAASGLSLWLPGISFSGTCEGWLSKLSAEQAAVATKQLSQFSPVILLILQIVSAIFAGCTVNALFALGEELGWRGYLLQSLKGKKFWHMALLTGIVWGFWHFPLILMGHNYPQHPVAGVFMMVIFCVLLTPVMTYLVLKSKSVITAAIYHGTLNAIAGISTLYLAGGNDLTNGTTGLAGFIALAIITSCFVLYDSYVTKEKIFFSKIK
ncbi:MAG: CPBP family intramembrane metalloprotease [Tannerella sp.]|jgi:membrane protease YdiL (CAAX protease family)|nr:CPBP family intramembrane metalloprotease [Tannerella sp.]